MKSNTLTHACFRIAHRGSSAHVVENTVAALKKSFKCHANMVEIDVRRCASGEVVLLHDRSMWRLAHDRHNVSDLTLQEIKALFPQIITLEQALNILAGRVLVYIEMKDRGMVESVLEIIRVFTSKKNWRESDFFVASHYAGQLHKASQIYPKIARIMIINSVSMGHVGNFVRMPYKKWQAAKRARASVLSFSRRLLRKAYVQQAHERGYKVFVWTVNKQEEIDRMKRWGVDGIISDYSERV